MAILDILKSATEKAQGDRRRLWKEYRGILDRDRIGRAKKADGDRLPELMRELDLTPATVEVHVRTLAEYAERVEVANSGEAASRGMTRLNARADELRGVMGTARCELEETVQPAIDVEQGKYIQSQTAELRVNELEKLHPELLTGTVTVEANEVPAGAAVAAPA